MVSRRAAAVPTIPCPGRSRSSLASSFAYPSTKAGVKVPSGWGRKMSRIR
jgi:hypothetical protein